MPLVSLLCCELSLIALLATTASVIGNCHRIGQLIDALERLSQKSQPWLAGEFQVAKTVWDDSKIALRDIGLSVSTHCGLSTSNTVKTELIRGLSFVLTRGESLVITGPR
jgi:ABC-type uncharacterized transport system fused permease/ATPase subunit